MTRESIYALRRCIAHEMCYIWTMRKETEKNQILRISTEVEKKVYPPNFSTMALRPWVLGGILGFVSSLLSNVGLFFFSLAAAASSGWTCWFPFGVVSLLGTRSKSRNRQEWYQRRIWNGMKYKLDSFSAKTIFFLDMLNEIFSTCIISL